MRAGPGCQSSCTYCHLRATWRLADPPLKITCMLTYFRNTILSAKNHAILLQTQLKMRKQVMKSFLKLACLGDSLLYLQLFCLALHDKSTE